MTAKKRLVFDVKKFNTVKIKTPNLANETLKEKYDIWYFHF